AAGSVDSIVELLDLSGQGQLADAGLVDLLFDSRLARQLQRGELSAGDLRIESSVLAARADVCTPDRKRGQGQRPAPARDDVQQAGGALDDESKQHKPPSKTRRARPW